ncbi:apiosidase-like domain-containing protein [Terrabacter sp. LjRoot27]|uniref:apiosidase-like domain-containing protein n=1 Tax=Terrabacter sp. LjRoot27 TaxID=3342306 RepID=UPI003F504709
MVPTGRCAPGDPSADPNSHSAAFPLTVDALQRQIVDRDGRPFLVVGDAAWSLIAQLSEADATAYLQSRRASGFNTILVNLIEHHFADNAPADIRGIPPFTTPGDFTRPNPEYFEHAERVVSVAEDLGFLVLLAPAYAGYAGGDQGWYREMQAMGPERLRSYGRFVGQRFAARDNVLWVQGGDFEVPEAALVNAVAEGIAEVSPGSLQTYHGIPDSRVAQVWRDQAWFTVDNVYTRGRPFTAVSEARSDGTDPLFLIEAAYENERDTPAADLRRQSYETIIAGGIGNVFGNNPIWNFDARELYAAPTDWRGQLDSPGTRGMTQFARIIGGTDWWMLRPDHGALLPRADPADTSQAVAALACDESFAVVYNPSSSPTELDPSALALPVTRGVWRDPVDGTSVAADLSDRDGAIITVRPPGRNAGGDTDWVLLLLTRSST